MSCKPTQNPQHDTTVMCDRTPSNLPRGRCGRAGHSRQMQQAIGGQHHAKRADGNGQLAERSNDERRQPLLPQRREVGAQADAGEGEQTCSAPLTAPSGSRTRLDGFADAAAAFARARIPFV